MPAKDFTIDKVSWHTETAGNPESPAMVRKRFRAIVDFLQTNGLTVRELLSAGSAPPDDFLIRASDLTDLGLAVMKKGYDKWLRKVANKRKEITDMRILKDAMEELSS